MKRSQIAMLLILASAVWARSDGPDARSTAAPGDDNPMSCAKAGCHTNNRTAGGPINAAGGKVTALFSTGDVFYPGIPVVITVAVSDPTNRRFGFQMTARQDSARTTQAGTFTTSGSDIIVICGDNSTRRTTCTRDPLEFVDHTRPATGGWQFTWTPSDTQTGAVHFYLSGNAVNDNGMEDGGDHVYTAEYILAPAPCPQPAATVTSVRSGTDFGGFEKIAAGTWVEIKGTNLANTSSSTFLRIWEGRDFLGSTAPTNLDGIRVSINGRSAPVYFISPGQINVQAPQDSSTGTTSVIVTTCKGASAGFSIPKETRVPGVLAPASFNKGGKQYMVAQLQDGIFVGATDFFPASSGVKTRPAKPGDLLTIYGIGFGDVTPTQPPGLVVSALNSTVAAVTFAFGTRQATLQYKGLAPGFVGLYQFNVTVPADTPDGDQQINVTVEGTALAQPAMFLTIQR